MIKRGNGEATVLKLHLLLLGMDESGFLYLSDLLGRIGHGQVSLDRARTLPEMLTCLAGASYDMVLCDYRPGEGMALRFLHEMTKHGHSVPVAFLSDHVDQTAVRAAIHAGVEAGALPADSPDESSLTRALCFAIDMYCKERQGRSAEDTLRKLWRTVEQTADLVMIADHSGVVEYVNPAFEAITGYSRKEAVGRTLRMLKPRQQPPAVYRTMWTSVTDGVRFPRHRRQPEKRWWNLSGGEDDYALTRWGRQHHALHLHRSRYHRAAAAGIATAAGAEDGCDRPSSRRGRS